MSFYDHKFHETILDAKPRPAWVARFEQLERDVIDMARSDGRWSLNPDGLLPRALKTVFGIRVPQGLANERLEALRRFAVAAWTRETVRVRDLRALFAAGYSSNDAWRVLAYVGEQRGGMPEVEAWPA